MIRVFVVDDSAFARRAITRVLRAEPAITVVGEASSGTEALLRVPSAQPDLVTLDLDPRRQLVGEAEPVLVAPLPQVLEDVGEGIEALEGMPLSALTLSPRLRLMGSEQIGRDTLQTFERK